jgi:hypothetical protein
MTMVLKIQENQLVNDISLSGSHLLILFICKFIKGQHTLLNIPSLIIIIKISNAAINPLAAVGILPSCSVSMLSIVEASISRLTRPQALQGENQCEWERSKF